MVGALIYHEIVSVWFLVLINRLRIVPYDLVSIANNIAPSGSGVESSRDCICVVPCFDKQVEDRAH